MPFQKGNKYGKGRPKKPEIEELRKAIKAVQKKKGKSLLRHFVERAYDDDRVLIALGKKIIPDLSSVDAGDNLNETFQSFISWLNGRNNANAKN